MAEEIADAWKDGRTNALAILTALSNKQGMNLPWSTVRKAIGEGIRAQWLELAEGIAPVDSDLASAQSVLLQRPAARAGQLEESRADYREGMLAAEVTLEGHGIQDLADLMPEILEAAVGDPFEFQVRIQFGGEVTPDMAKVERINELLAEVSEELRLGGGVLG